MRSFLFKKNFRGYTMFLRVISSFLFFFAENIREVNLIIEQGNTSSKVAVYKNGHIEASFVYKQFGVSVVAALFEKYAFTQGILSTVIDTDDELIAYLKNKLQRFVFLDEHVALPIKVEYGTPKTLGKDRLAAVVGANYFKQDNQQSSSESERSVCTGRHGITIEGQPCIVPYNLRFFV